MPRSHKTMLRLPLRATYSAAINPSSIVACSPRFSMAGLSTWPTACSNPKFCMLRVPICSMSAYCTTTSTSCASTTSVTKGSPTCSLVLARISRPFSPSPWNAYGDVRGLYAPPRSIAAPAAFAISAASRVCSALSTAHGPAIKVKVSGPMGTPPTVIVDLSGWFSRLTSLYGVDTRTTLVTPGIARRLRVWNCSMSPTRPTIVRVTPRLTKAEPPASSTRDTIAATSSEEASGLITTTIGLTCPYTTKAPDCCPGLDPSGALLVRGHAALRPGDPGRKRIEPAVLQHASTLPRLHRSRFQTLDLALGTATRAGLDEQHRGQYAGTSEDDPDAYRVVVDEHTEDPGEDGLHR